MTASSEHSIDYSAHESRIDSTSAWATTWGNDGAWISADLGETRIVMVIRTRGYEHPVRGDAYVTQFKVSTSANGVELADVVNESGTAIEFQGNSDAETPVPNPMPASIVTQHVKLTVLAYVEWPAMRWAIDGYPVPAN